MSKSLDSKTVHESSGLTNKICKVKRSWWTDKLQQLYIYIYIAFMDADKRWCKAYVWKKSNLTAERCHSQKQSDQEKQ